VSTMSSDNPKPDQIQANVAAALSRLRGDVMPPVTSQAVPKLTENTENSTANPSPTPTPSPAAQSPGTPPPMQTAPGFSANADFRAEPSLGIGNGASSASAPSYFGNAAKLTRVLSGQQPDLLSSVDMGPPSQAGYQPSDDNNDGRRKRNRRLVLAGAVAAIAVVAAIWLGIGHKSEVPVITADNTPEKVKPTDEGGLQVPNQNVQVLENMNGQNQPQASETVLPPPEQPVAPPAPAAAADPQGLNTAGQQPAAGQATSGEPAAGQTAASQAPAGQTSITAPAVPAVPEAPAVPPVPGATNTAASTTPAAPSAAVPSETAGSTTTGSAAPAATQTAAKPVAEASKKTEAAPATAGGKLKIQLAAVKTEAAAKSVWSELQKAHPAELGSLSLIVEKVDKGANGVFYRVQAGPIADRAAGKTLCAELAKQKQACILAR